MALDEILTSDLDCITITSNFRDDHILDYPGCQWFFSLRAMDGIGEEKPLVQAFENLTSMPCLIDIKKPVM